MGFHSDFVGFYGGFLGFYDDWMGFYGHLIRFYGDAWLNGILWWFNVDLMVIYSDFMVSLFGFGGI